MNAWPIDNPSQKQVLANKPAISVDFRARRRWYYIGLLEWLVIGTLLVFSWHFSFQPFVDPHGNAVEYRWPTVGESLSRGIVASAAIIGAWLLGSVVMRTKTRRNSLRVRTVKCARFRSAGDEWSIRPPVVKMQQASGMLMHHRRP